MNHPPSYWTQKVQHSSAIQMQLNAIDYLIQAVTHISLQSSEVLLSTFYDLCHIPEQHAYQSTCGITETISSMEHKHRQGK